MKKFKLGFVVLCGLMLSFGACKKDSKSPSTPNNSFIINNNNYATTLASATEYNPDPETELILSNKAVAGGTSGLNIVYFDFYLPTLPTSGTFTYQNNSAAGFDPTKNFDDVVVAYGATYTTSQTLTGGTQYSTVATGTEGGGYDATGSTVTISKNGNTYTFVYNLKFTKGGNTITISGQYSGSVTK